MLRINNQTVNQKGTPAIITDVFSNRPLAPNIAVGTIFMSSNTNTIYQVVLTGGVHTWVTMGGGGGGSQNLDSVLSQGGNFTNNRTSQLNNYSWYINSYETMRFTGNIANALNSFEVYTNEFTGIKATQTAFYCRTSEDFEYNGLYINYEDANLCDALIGRIADDGGSSIKVYNSLISGNGITMFAESKTFLQADYNYLKLGYTGTQIFLQIEAGQIITPSTYYGDYIGLKINNEFLQYYIGDGDNINNGTSIKLDDNTSGGQTIEMTCNNQFTLNTENIQLNGTNLIDGTAGGNSGDHLIIEINGNTYKIALLNP